MLLKTLWTYPGKSKKGKVGERSGISLFSYAACVLKFNHSLLVICTLLLVQIAHKFVIKNSVNISLNSYPRKSKKGKVGERSGISLCFEI